MGRAATLNGNGRAVLPPAVLEPMRRYQQPEPPRRSTRNLLLRIFGWIVLALLVVAAGLAGGVYLYGHETLNAIAPHSRGVKQSTKDLKAVASPSDPATALIIGYDQRAGADKSTAAGSRSDTVMLVRADPTNNTLSLLSFPRDLIVPIYCNGSTVPIAHDRINSAWSRCGARGTLDTVAHLTNVPINYLITLDFHGFKLLVNKLHGVYVDVDHRYLNTVGGPGGYAKIDLEPGYQRLDGQQALDFVRFRHTDSDLYRLARQQLFLEALKDRLASSFNLLEIPRLVGAVKHSVEVGKSSGGAPSLSEIQSYAGLAYHLPAGHIFRNSIENVADCGFLAAEVCANTSDVQTAVDSFMHPDVTLPGRANAIALGRKPKAAKQPALKASEITTLVLNGTTVAGLARDTSYKLAVAGYHTVQLPASMLADAPPRQNVEPTVVYFDSIQPSAKRAAVQLMQAMGRNTVIKPLPPEIAPYAQQAGNPLTVVEVGTGFGGEVVDPAAHVAQTPEHVPPAVKADPGLLLGPLQEIRAKVPFPLMLPHQIASNSTLTQLEPVRVFKPAAHQHEVALTFVTYAGNVYWQIIETDWSDAPILRHPTGKVKLKDGRKLDLFTNGGHVHMAVLRQGGRSYWVVNTLRDELSNETMIAIARGLAPLGK